jgi:hypothetical protein
MSIMSQYDKGLDHLRRLPQKKAATPAVPAGKGAEAASGAVADPPVDADAEAVALATLPAVRPDDDDAEDAVVSPETRDMAVQVVKGAFGTRRGAKPPIRLTPLTPLPPSPPLPISISDLEKQGAVHMATMQAMERTSEWKDYESHVTFELNLIRARYAAADEPMTPARRAQLDAHLRAKQTEIMNDHAEAAAERFISALTPREVDELRSKLRGIDVSAASLPGFAEGGSGPGAKGGAAGGGGSIFDGDLRDALWQVSSMLSAAEKSSKVKGAMGPPPAALPPGSRKV